MSDRLCDGDVASNIVLGVELEQLCCNIMEKIKQLNDVLFIF